MKNPLRFTLALLTAAAALAGQKDKTLDVYWIDSEGGGSTLIVTPNDESVLIDAGNPGGRDPSRILAAAKAAGIAKIDFMLITHWHADHFGGAAEVAAGIPVGRIYQRAMPATDPDLHGDASWVLRSQPFRAIDVKREALAPGVAIPLRPVAGGPQLGLRCLAADKKTVEPTAAQLAVPPQALGETPPPKVEEAPDNDNSAVLLLTFGPFKFFDGGDLTWNYEPNLVLPHNLVGPVDVYQTDHHGLDRSNNPLLIHGLAPTVAVMNNGPRKGGQRGTFATLRSTPSIQAWYQLHRSLNAPDDNAPDEFLANLVEAKPADKCTANFVKMVVAPDASSYTISIPANGHSHTYQTKAR